MIGEMPSLTNNSLSSQIQVTLLEVLEVKGQALTEAELWALLCQATEAVQDVFIRGTDIHVRVHLVQKQVLVAQNPNEKY